jgi:hypothetical protein
MELRLVRDGYVRVAHTPTERVRLQARGWVKEAPEAVKALPDVEVVRDVPPPRGGEGSGREHWVAFAEAHGVPVTALATREEIIESCEAAELLEAEMEAL